MRIRNAIGVASPVGGGYSGAMEKGAKHRAALVAVGLACLVGCFSTPPRPPNPIQFSTTSETMRREILKHVPYGMPLKQARGIMEANGFTCDPIAEVAILFAGIFACIIPVLAMLQAGKDGAFAWLLAAVTEADGSPHDIAYFWLTGVLSAFLDNAPTYLVFFELAGGDARTLMTTLASTLAAISMGAVYMGALTYIGNAPNLMVYAIAVERGVKMPSFFGYLAWAAAILLPVLALVTFVFVVKL